MNRDHINHPAQWGMDQLNIQERYWDDCSRFGHRLIVAAEKRRNPLAEVDLWVNAVAEMRMPQELVSFLKMRAGMDRQTWLFNGNFIEDLRTFLQETARRYQEEQRSDIIDHNEQLHFHFIIMKSLLMLVKMYVFAQSEDEIRTYN